MKEIARFIVMIFIFALVIPVACWGHDQPDYVAQPNDQFSAICSFDTKAGVWDDITDYEFAQKIEEKLETGEVYFNSLIFVFQQCFGGGFLDDLTYELNGDWIGSSASLYNETSYSTSYGTSDSITEDEYTHAWKNSDELNLADRHYEAKNNDPCGPNGADHARFPEHPQVTGQGWEFIDLGVTECKHAILFSGKTELRHWNDLMNVRNELINEGEFLPENIKVYSGNGGKPPGAPGGDPLPDGLGTKDNLFQAIEEAAAGSSYIEQLFVYVTDHGDRHIWIEKNLIPIIPSGVVQWEFVIEEDFFKDMMVSILPGPDLSLIAFNVAPDSFNEVKLNNKIIGNLIFGANAFSIDSCYHLQPGENILEIKSNQSKNLNVGRISLGTGPIPTRLKIGEEQESLCLKYFGRYQDCVEKEKAGRNLDFGECQHFGNKNSCVEANCFWDTKKNRCYIDLCLADFNFDGMVTTPDFRIEKWEFGRQGCPCDLWHEYGDFSLCAGYCCQYYYCLGMQNTGRNLDFSECQLLGNQSLCEKANCFWDSRKQRCYTDLCLAESNFDGMVTTPDFVVEKWEFGRMVCP